MKILQINASYKPAFIYGGPTMSVSKLSEELVKAAVEVDVFTTTANGNKELDIAVNVPVNVAGVRVTYFTRLTGDHSHFSPALLWALWKHCREYDLIHIHAWWNLVSVFATLIAQLRKVPVVISPRGTLSSYTFSHKKNLVKKSLHFLLGRQLLSRSYIHATSAAESRHLKGIFKARKVINLPNFVDFPAKIAPGHSGPETGFRLLFLSRIEQKKGLELLLEALPLIDLPFTLTIVGDGDKDYIAGLKNRLNEQLRAPQVEWTGFQGAHKFNTFQEHHLLVLPSYDENFGNVIIESLAMGTAVLISEQVGLADYVKERELGWICQTEPRSIAENIRAIMANRQEDLLRIRQNAPAIITQDFDGRELVKKYIEHYNEIIAYGRIQ